MDSISPFPSAEPARAPATMRPHVPERVAGTRVERLLALAAWGKAAYIGSWLGREVEMVVERASSGTSRVIGTTENYLKAELIGNGNGDLLPGRAVNIVLQGASKSKDVEMTARPADRV